MKHRVTELNAEAIFFASSGARRTDSTVREQHSEKMAYSPIIRAEFLALPESRLV